MAILCLLMLVSANIITTSWETVSGEDYIANPADQNEDQSAPSPLEEDTTEEDDETSKAPSFQGYHGLKVFTGKLRQGNQFLTGFHFLEIVSPPPRETRVPLPLQA